jgi:hypothetical protein
MFSKINESLLSLGEQPINWQLPLTCTELERPFCRLKRVSQQHE